MKDFLPKRTIFIFELAARDISAVEMNKHERINS